MQEFVRKTTRCLSILCNSDNAHHAFLLTGSENLCKTGLSGKRVRERIMLQANTVIGHFLLGG